MKRWPLGRALLIAVGTLLVVGLARPWSPALTRLAERRLSESLGQPVTIGRLQLHFFPPELELTDVRIDSPRPGTAPLLEASRVSLRPSAFTLFSSRPVLSRVRLERPRLHIAAFADGTSNLPRTKESSSPRNEIRIRRFIVEGGEIVVDHERIPLDLDLPDLQARLTSRRDGGVGGPVAFAPGRLRFGSAPEMPFGLSADVEWRGRRVGLSNARLHTQKTDLRLDGELFLEGGVRGLLSLRGAVDLAELDRHVFKTGLDLRGRGTWAGRTTIDGSTVRFEGHLDARDGAFDRIDVLRCSMDVDWDGTDLRLRRIATSTLGGTAALDVDVPTTSQGTVRVKGTMQGLDTEALFSYVLGIGKAGVVAASTGPVDVSWPKGRGRLVTGRVGLDLVGGSDGRTPLSGRLDWTATVGAQTVERAELRTPTTTLRASGRIDATDHATLDVHVASADLGATDDLGARLLRALGSPSADRVGLTGRGTFEGRMKGTLHDPVFEGHFAAPSVSYLGVDWGAAEWEGELDGNELRSRSLVARRGDSVLKLAGRTQTGALGDRDAMELRVALSEWPAEDFVKAFDWKLDATGPLTGDFVFTDRRSAPRGTGRTAAKAGIFHGVPFTDLDLDLVFRGDVTEARSGKARVGDGDVTFFGTMTDAGSYDGSWTVSGVEIEGLLPAREGVPALAGRVWGGGRLRGTLERPELDAKITSPRLFLGDEGLGDLDAALTGRGDGTLLVVAASRSPRFDVNLRGTFSAQTPNHGELHLQIRDTNLDPYLRSVAPGLPSAVRLVASGAITIRGPLATPDALEAQVEATSLDVVLPEYAMKSAGPARARYASGRLEIEQTRLTGEGSDVEVAGSVGVTGTKDLSFSARGRSDLRVVSVFTERLRGRGAAQIRLDVSGTARAPRLDGTLNIDGGGVRARGFPQGLEDVRGVVRFTENVAVLESVRGTAGGGPISLEGQASYAGGRLSAFDIRATGRDVSLNYPEGLRSTIGADLRFFGDASRQWITGSVDVKEAIFTRRYDVASQLFSSATTLASGTSLYEGLRYDVKIRAPGSLRIDNNLATLSARAELALQGTYDRPVLVGRSEIEQGRVYFQGQSYTIRHGTLDFANPQRIDPFFDIEAEARVRSYTVILRLNGTLDRVTPTLTSDPPLDTLGVLSLLAGAPESTVTDSAFQSGSERVQQNLAVAGAAALVSRAAPLTREVQQGAEKVAERIGLNRFSIDPSLARGSNTNPTARLSLGKRITRDVDFYYSVDLKSTQEQLYSLEYTVSRRLSILFTKADPQGAGVDLRLKNSQ